MSNDPSDTQNNIMLGIGFLVAGLSAALLVALLIMFPPLGLALIPFYGAAVASAGLIVGILTYFGVGVLYNPSKNSIFYGTSSPSRMRNTMWADMRAQDDARDTKACVQGGCSVLLGSCVAIALLSYFVATPFVAPVIIMIASVVTGVGVGIVLGAIAASIAYCYIVNIVNQKEKPSSNHHQAKVFTSSTRLSNNTLRPSNDNQINLELSGKPVGTPQDAQTPQTPQTQQNPENLPQSLSSYSAQGLRN